MIRYFLNAYSIQESCEHIKGSEHMSEFARELTDSAVPFDSNRGVNQHANSDDLTISQVENKDSLTALVTVVMPNYNAGNYLKEAVESVLHQTYTNWKMIIIDDASTDNSLTLIYPYLHDPRIRLIQSSENVGQTKCLNIALDAVTTPYMVQLDSDDWFYPHTLETLVKETNHIGTETGLISGNIKLVWKDKSGKTTKTRIKYGRNFSGPYDFMRAGQSCWPRFYRTDAVRTVGGWPVDGPYDGRYIEDLRILYQLIPKYQFHWIDETLYIHRRHQHNMTRQVKEMRETLYWLIRDTLKKWGDQYTPKYRLTKSGYPKLIALVSKRRNKRTQRRLGQKRRPKQGQRVGRKTKLRRVAGNNLKITPKRKK